jgi:ABC-type multidrug transport system fused ATPase/permease subunit
MMARLQAGGLADQAYEAELEALDRRIAGDDARRGRLWPVMMMAGGVAIAVMLLGLGLNTLQGEQGLSLPSALVLGLALTGAALAAARLSELKRQLRHSSKACESVYLYLQPNSEVSPSEQRVGLGGLRDCVTMEDVSLQDSAGKAILRDLSLSLRPKSLVAFLGTEEISTRALLELLMGFGRPHRGKVQIDGISLLDVHPQALAKNVMWVGPDGPLWEGSLRENLMAGVDRSVDNRDMVETLERLGIYERITRLPEGLETIIEPGSNLGSGDDSDSLGTDVRYAVGIARAMLHRPPIVLAKEPPAPTEHVNEDPCLNALRELADAGSLVVVLPHRLKTLRSCDRVMLLNGPNLVGEGRHTELLNSSDLYRHLNYLLFNPYRHRSPS